MSEFSDNLRKLLEETPDRLTGHVEVDQVYAHYQHEGVNFEHPDGGEPFYLKTPLYAKAGDYYRNLAEKAIDATGTKLREAMIENMEDLSNEVYKRAPWEFADLRASGHPTVEEDGTVVYDRAPMCHRLTEDELKIKSHLSYLLDPHRYRSSWR